MPVALITGITGQDGRYLAELLHQRDYTVIGLVRGQANPKAEQLAEELPFVIQVNGDLADSASLLNALDRHRPDEIYNLGAYSFVGGSWAQPELVADITGLGALRLFEAARRITPDARIYQASSSEMFGKVHAVPQVEDTFFHPRSPYGVAKVYAHYAAVNYRESYGMHISCGILFNHESERRGVEFVTRKITDGVAKIKHGLADHIKLGTLEPQRDWGHAEDYVAAMWQMCQQDKADDYVIATGETHTIAEFCEKAFTVAGIDNWQDRIRIDEQFARPAEVDLLVGNPTKAEQQLGWQRHISFDRLVERMTEHDLARLAPSGR